MIRNLILVSAVFAASACFAAPSTEGFELRHVADGTAEYDIAELDLKHVNLKLFWKNQDDENFASLTAVRDYLRSGGKTFLFATNSGIYAEDYSPMGLHIERGKVLHKVNRSCASRGNFFKCPNGIFLLTDKGAKVIYTTEFAKFSGKIIEAAQSGPILLRNGKIHPAFRKNSGNLKLRSGVGVDRDGHVVFAVSDGAVEFWEFAQFFKNTLHCQDALYLDGTISVFLTAHSGGGQLKPFAGIWAASLRNSPEPTPAN